jgi:hypothetical protein
MRCVVILGLALLVYFMGEASGQPISSEVKSAAGKQLAADTPMTTATPSPKPVGAANSR